MLTVIMEDKGKDRNKISHFNCADRFVKTRGVWQDVSYVHSVTDCLALYTNV